MRQPDVHQVLHVLVVVPNGFGEGGQPRVVIHAYGHRRKPGAEGRTNPIGAILKRSRGIHDNPWLALIPEVTRYTDTHPSDGLEVNLEIVGDVVQESHGHSDPLGPVEICRVSVEDRCHDLVGGIGNYYLDAVSREVDADDLTGSRIEGQMLCWPSSSCRCGSRDDGDGLESEQFGGYLGKGRSGHAHRFGNLAARQGASTTQNLQNPGPHECCAPNRAPQCASTYPKVTDSDFFRQESDINKVGNIAKPDKKLADRPRASEEALGDQSTQGVRSEQQTWQQNVVLE